MELNRLYDEKSEYTHQLVVEEEDRILANAYPGQRTDGTINEKTRVLRLFNLTQIFFFTLTFMSSWEAIAGNLQAAMTNGGPRALVWGFVIVIAGALAQSASLAEMAATQPIAGAQYHWTHALAPARHRRFITWMQAYITWFGWVSLLVGIANSTCYLLQSLVVANYPSYNAQPWHLTLMIFALLIILGLITTYAFFLVPWFEVVAGVLHIVLFIMVVVVFTSLASKHDAKFVFTKSYAASGWTNKFVSFNLGLLTPSWGFVGFDGVVHMSEEVRRARQAVPRVMFWTNVLNGILTFAMIMTLLFCLGDIDAAVSAPYPLLEVATQATGSLRGATALLCGFSVISSAATLGSVASASRLTWAWARDGGLPAWFAHISPRQRVPVRSVWLPIFLVMCLACINIGNYAAFGAFIALSSLALYISYAIAIVCMLRARIQNKVQYGGWRLGRFGVTVNVFALIYTCWMSVIFCFPQFLPVTASNFNYSLPIFAVVVLYALISWFVWAKKRWPGLNKEIIDVVLADSDRSTKDLLS